MKEDGPKKFAAKLGVPDFAKIAEKERSARSDERKAEVTKENAAFVLKHIADHQKFLRLVHKQDSKDVESTINTLSDMATETIKTLDKCLSQMRVEEVDRLAQNCTSRKIAWPINVSTPLGKELKSQISYIFDTLKLGDNSMFNVRYKRTTRRDGEKALIAQEAIFKMLQNVERYRVKYKNGGGDPPYSFAGKLEPLNSSNAADWFNLIMTILEHNSYGKPWNLDFNSSSSDSLFELVTIDDRRRKRYKTPSEKHAEKKDGARLENFKKKMWLAFLAIINPEIRDDLRRCDGTDPSHPSCE
jgi:hypothetical protein